IPDMPRSLKLLEDARTSVNANPQLSSVMEVVEIHETGPDWILRDFDPNTVELKSANDAAAQATRSKAIADLEALKKEGRLTDVLEDLLKKLKKEPPSANLHWSATKQKIIVIDMQ